MSTRLSMRSLAPLALLALAACGGTGDNLSELDNALLANGADPALTSALEDQIMVDPNLVQQSHPNTVRPPETPVQAQYPAGSTRENARLAGVRNPALPTVCNGAPIDIGAGWASRLPREFPLYPGGQVTEAGGVDQGDCRVRVVTFRTPDPHRSVLEHYSAVARRAGFSAEHQVRGSDHVLGGVNEASDGAFFLIVTPQDQGSEVALIVNNGR